MAVVPGGREALTFYKQVRQDEQSALVLIRLMTGRTHQIRVHFSAARHPVLGDTIYGHRAMPQAPRLMLHAWSLAFSHPITGEQLRFSAQPEPAFKAPPAEELDSLLPFPPE